MIVGVIGAEGFIGSYVAAGLERAGCSVKKILHVPQDLKHFYFDVLINSAGNSRKYLAERDPFTDFIKNVSETYRYITSLEFDKYVHISSVDATMTETHYGFNKSVADQVVRHFLPTNSSILRCSSVVGKGMTKGVLFDILNDREVRVLSSSKIGIVSVEYVAEAVRVVVDRRLYGRVFTMSSSDRTGPDEIAGVVGKSIKYSSEAVEQIYVACCQPPDGMPCRTVAKHIADAGFAKDEGGVET